MPIKNKPTTSIIPVEIIQQRILIIRGHRVITDADLAKLYGVTTKRLNEAVKRNADRFPADFMFQLTWDEAEILRSQFATLRPIHGKHRKYRPYAFTEHGAIMAATVLSSPQAVHASLFVVRAFVKLRQLLSTHHELAAKLDQLERKLEDHDGQIIALIDAIRQLMTEPEDPPKPPIGFHTELAAPREKSKFAKAKKI